MKSYKFMMLCLLALSLATLSCKEEVEPLAPPIDDHPIITIEKEGVIVLGKKLEDPYAIENMKKAYSVLKSRKSGTTDVDLQPTHTYMRFFPQSEEELGLLKKDTTLVLYDFPLNYEIASQGTYYHDPAIADTAITYQYCVVKKDYVIPNVQHELLYDVLIPPDSSTTKGIGNLQQFYEELEYESVKLTGNLPKEDSNTKGLFPSKWTPKGTIRVWDNLLGMYIPLVQASVHARWFVRIETDLTDGNGYFQTDRFRFEVNYAIKWERSHYDIRNGMFLQAWYNGPKKKGDWNLDISGGESIMYATMHRAAYKHFYGDNLGLNRPILMSGGKTKICYRDGNGTGVFWGDWSATGILPDIQVWGKTNGVYKPTQEIFGTTAHELGHQAHSQNLGNIQYWQVSKIIYESWADAVEWALSNDEYHYWGNRFGIAAGINYNHPYNKHRSWPFVNDKAYSPIFIDLMDNKNQRDWGVSYPNDLISGYTLSYINFSILRNAYGLSSLHDEIKKHKITGVTDSQIDELFALYW